MHTATQLYTFRDLELSLPAILELAARAGYDGVELALRAWDADPDRLAAALEETGLAVPGAHVSLDAVGVECCSHNHDVESAEMEPTHPSATASGGARTTVPLR